MTTHNRNVAEKPGIPRNVSIVMRAAVAQLTKPLSRKPQPSDFWYELTGADAELKNVQLDSLIIRSRQALEAAKGEGEGVLAATRFRVEILFATAFAVSVHGYEGPGDNAGLQPAVVKLLEEIADVVAAAAHVQRDPSHGNVERLRFELLESLDIGEHVADLSAMQLACAG